MQSNLKWNTTFIPFHNIKFFTLVFVASGTYLYEFVNTVKEPIEMLESRDKVIVYNTN